MRSDRWISPPLLCAVFLGLVCSAGAADWSHWRGPEQNGVSRDTGLPEKFILDKNNPDYNLIWRAPHFGRATPIVQNNRVYFLSRTGNLETQQEKVVCLDADTGKTIKEQPLNVFFTDIVAVRLGWSSVAGDPETGNVYAHGTQGYFICYDKDLKEVWKHSLTEEYGRISGYGGRLASPIVDGDLVILGMLNSSWGELARGGPRFVAFDKKTGKVVWWASTGLRAVDTFYSSPVVAVIGGQRLLVSGAGDGYVHAFKVRTGEKVWSYPVGPGMLNCSPVVSGNLVYIGQGEENTGEATQGTVLCLDGATVADGKPTLKWRVDGIKVKYASPIIHEGRLYVSDEVANLYCLDAKDGKELWQQRFGRNSKGSPVWADGKIYIPDVNSKFAILKPGPDACEVLSSITFRKRPGGGDIEINGGPAIVNGRIYFCTSDETFCFGTKDGKAGSVPAGLKEDEVVKGAKPAYLAVSPADVMLNPGEKAEFKARVFDDRGHFLREVEAKWSLSAMTPPPPIPGAPVLPGPMPPLLKGELSDGKLTVDGKTPGQFGNVIAEFEGLKGTARVRVAPVLPYKQDFENVPVNRTPAGWVNAMGKYAVQAVGKDKVLVKLGQNPSPLVARANAFITVPDTPNGYTVECDILGQKSGPDIPDMGIVAGRYTLMLAGARQELRLLSWEALPRVDRSLGMPWKPDVWYHMKLTVALNGDKAKVQGKLWERGKDEPKDWTVEVEDPLPNKEGSAGLYGFAPSPKAEILYDNLTVTPAKK